MPIMCALVLSYLLENGRCMGEGYFSKKNVTTGHYFTQSICHYLEYPPKKFRENFVIICHITKTDWQNM